MCGERSWLRLVSQAAGWTNAFLDRLLMAVILLRDEVGASRHDKGAVADVGR